MRIKKIVGPVKERYDCQRQWEVIVGAMGDVRQYRTEAEIRELGYMAPLPLGDDHIGNINQFENLYMVLLDTLAHFSENKQLSAGHAITEFLKELGLSGEDAHYIAELLTTARFHMAKAHKAAQEYLNNAE